MQFGQFSQRALWFFRPVLIGCFQNHLDDLIAPRILAGVENAAIPQAELLIVLRAGRNLEQRLAVDGGHFDLGSEPRFGQR